MPDLMKRPPRDFFIRKKIYLLAFALAAGGCTSIGVPYPSADNTPDAAEVIDGRGVLINSVNEKGCYTGRTAMGKNFRLRPGEKVVQTAESSGGLLGASNFCRAIIDFTPQSHARYVLRPEIVSTPIKGLLGEQTSLKGCRLGVKQLGEDGVERPVAVEPRVLRTGFACIRFVNPQAEESEIQ